MGDDRVGPWTRLVLAVAAVILALGCLGACVVAKILGFG